MCNVVNISFKRRAFKVTTLCGVLFCMFLFMSCGNPDETPSPPEPITTYSRNDLTGVWVLKGNSSTMALVSLNLSYGLTYYGYWGDYSARYELIEYELNNSNYAFKGRYSGGLIFSENTIKFDKADTYMPQLKTAGSEYNDEISRQHSFYKDFSVELLNETKTKFRFSSGNLLSPFCLSDMLSTNSICRILSS